MSLRNQPYFPLYVQDFLTDEKLIECSAESTGVYIRLICILHKSEEYGTIILKQKDKICSSKTSSKCFLFACKLAKQMPYSIDIIEKSLEELFSEDVISIDGDYLRQKRMIKDNEISIKRANAGRVGGKSSQANFAQAKHQAKHQANTEYENENINSFNLKEDSVKETKKIKDKKFVPPTLQDVINYAKQSFDNNFSQNEPQDFINYHTTSGWLVSRGGKMLYMSNWKSAYNTWHQNSIKWTPKTPEQIASEKRSAEIKKQIEYDKKITEEANQNYVEWTKKLGHEPTAEDLGIRVDPVMAAYRLGITVEEFNRRNNNA